MSRGEGVEVPFLVYVRSSMSQVVDVKALTIAQAIERGPGLADVPNSSNSFEPEGDPVAWAVMDSGGNQLWCAADETEVAAQVETLLTEHAFAPGDDETPGECVGTTCTWHGWTLGDWRKHVAEVIAAHTSPAAS
ncbi:hypothetical protein [Mycolicibacterium llatzerense]|uniref:hypothetical protein n=1 Tax=Mycolicibacterium llatzerense TaxID=280871 RepID=UPI0021B4E198|nr:hypothetical protein [Mycolicibacterium llatzerense]MCT7372724.1 hypothetical protein [Mycolicibacterium llatzerense]